MVIPDSILILLRTRGRWEYILHLVWKRPKGSFRRNTTCLTVFRRQIRCWWDSKWLIAVLMDALRINEAFGINFRARGSALNATTWDPFGFQLSITRAGSVLSKLPIVQFSRRRIYIFLTWKQTFSGINTPRVSINKYVQEISFYPINKSGPKMLESL